MQKNKIEFLKHNSIRYLFVNIYVYYIIKLKNKTNNTCLYLRMLLHYAFRLIFVYFFTRTQI